MQARGEGDEDWIDRIYFEIDELMRANRFVRVDEILADPVNAPETLPILRSLALLSITRVAKNLLPAREEYARRVRAHFERVVPDRVEGLLAGLA